MIIILLILADIFYVVHEALYHNGQHGDKDNEVKLMRLAKKYKYSAIILAFTVLGIALMDWTDSTPLIIPGIFLLHIPITQFIYYPIRKLSIYTPGQTAVSDVYFMNLVKGYKVGYWIFNIICIIMAGISFYKGY